MLKAKEEFETSARHANTGTVGRTSDLETDTRYKWHRGGRKKVVKIEDLEEIQELLTVRLGRKDAGHSWVSMSNPREDGTMSKSPREMRQCPVQGKMRQCPVQGKMGQCPVQGMGGSNKKCQVHL